MHISIERKVIHFMTAEKAAELAATLNADADDGEEYRAMTNDSGRSFVALFEADGEMIGTL